MEEIIQYVTELKVVGEEINTISNKIGTAATSINPTAEELKRSQQTVELLAMEYRKVRRKLEGLTVPSIVKTEHRELIEDIQGFINGTNTIISSYNVDEATIDNEAFLKGVEEQKKARANIVITNDKIANKLLSVK